LRVECITLVMQAIVHGIRMDNLLPACGRQALQVKLSAPIGRKEKTSQSVKIGCRHPDLAGCKYI